MLSEDTVGYVSTWLHYFRTVVCCADVRVHTPMLFFLTTMLSSETTHHIPLPFYDENVVNSAYTTVQLATRLRCARQTHNNMWTVKPSISCRDVTRFLPTPFPFVLYESVPYRHDEFAIRDAEERRVLFARMHQEQRDATLLPPNARVPLFYCEEIPFGEDGVHNDSGIFRAYLY